MEMEKSEKEKKAEEILRDMEKKLEELGFFLRYPAAWSIEASSETSVDFVPEILSRPGVNVSVYDSRDEGSLRETLDIESEKKIEVDGQPASEITNAAEGQNPAETVVLVKNGGLLYAVRGTPGSVRAFMQTFNFIK